MLNPGNCPVYTSKLHDGLRILGTNLVCPSFFKSSASCTIANLKNSRISSALFKNSLDRSVSSENAPVNN